MLLNYRNVFGVAVLLYFMFFISTRGTAIEKTDMDGLVKKSKKSPKKNYPKEIIPGYSQKRSNSIHPNIVENHINSLENAYEPMKADMDLGIFIEPGEEQCYWIHVMEGSTLFVSSMALKGGNGGAVSIGLGVKQPDGNIVHPYSWLPNDEYLEHDTQEGYYCVCIDNLLSPAEGKLVELIINTYSKEGLQVADVIPDTLAVNYPYLFMLMFAAKNILNC